MSQPPRWAVSPRDGEVHLLAAGGHRPGLLKARCGAQVPYVAAPSFQPPAGPPCSRCHVIHLADAADDDPASKLAMVLDALRGVELTQAEMADLAWLAGLQTSAVATVAVLLTRARVAVSCRFCGRGPS